MHRENHTHAQTLRQLHKKRESHTQSQKNTVKHTETHTPTQNTGFITRHTRTQYHKQSYQNRSHKRTHRLNRTPASPTSDPHAEAKEVEIALALHRIPTEIRVPALHQVAVALETAPGQVDGDLLQVVLSGECERGSQMVLEWVFFIGILELWVEGKSG